MASPTVASHRNNLVENFSEASKRGQKARQLLVPINLCGASLMPFLERDFLFELEAVISFAPSQSVSLSFHPTLSALTVPQEDDSTGNSLRQMAAILKLQKLFSCSYELLQAWHQACGPTMTLIVVRYHGKHKKTSSHTSA